MAIQQFSQSLPIMLYRTLDAIMPRFRRIFLDAGLTEQQWRVLRVLWDRNEVVFRELADLTLIAPPSLVGVIDRLETRGLVSRRRSTSDRRAVDISLTAEGRSIENQVMPAVASAYAELKQSVDPIVWQQLLAGLEQLTDASQPKRR